jgi:cell division protein FtsN
MKAFIVACVAAVVIAVVCGVVLNTVQEPADRAFTSASSVRLGA